MKSKILITVIFLTFIAIFFSINNSDVFEKKKKAFEKESVEQSNAPQIELDRREFYFGTVVYGDIAEEKFHLKNVGLKDLEILRISTSCGCTKATLQEDVKVIPPGENVPLVVTFDPAVHKNDTDLGDLTRVVYIKTNDPMNPEIELTLTAHVIKK